MVHSLGYLLLVHESELPSTEGTTQSDSLTIDMYALAVTHPLCHCQPQVWYANDATAAGMSQSLFQW